MQSQQKATVIRYHLLIGFGRVRFAPGATIYSSSAEYVNDITAAQQGKNLSISEFGIDFVSQPNGKVFSAFTGVLIPNPNGPHEGKAIYELY